MEVSDSASAALVRSALCDILYMFRDLIKSYRGFGHNIDTGDFDPFALSRAYIIGHSWYTAEDMELLYAGCGVKIICWLKDLWDDFDSHEVATMPFHLQVRVWLTDGADFLAADLRELIVRSLEAESCSDDLALIYRSCVVRVFDWLANNG